MPTVTCPSCGEKGKIPPSLVGARIKCKKCATSFLVSAPANKAPTASEPVATPVVVRRSGQEIEVDGLDESAWATVPVDSVEPDHHHAEPHHEEAIGAFTAQPEAHTTKQYKVLTPKDKYFANKFSIELLEDALNHFARQGWTVRGMATPHVAGFSGGDREQFVIVLER
jgi:Domain of unknown function (DUF4177)